jgi:hypothetical protein
VESDDPRTRFRIFTVIPILVVLGWVGGATTVTTGAHGPKRTPPAPASHPTTFARAGRDAVKTLLHTYYAGRGRWHVCSDRDCAPRNVDWGADSLTYTLVMRARLTGGRDLVPVLRALTKSARRYPSPCRDLASCSAWSDVPEWDAIALADEYEVTHDRAALSKAQSAFHFVAGASVYKRGSCPAIPYQHPGGRGNHLKTLETTANAVKAALLLYRATGKLRYLKSAVADYRAARRYFLDRNVPLYTVYVFDDGHRCHQLRRRFFASVNGDMIWSGVELFRATADAAYLVDASATATAVAQRLADGRGIFADLQAENDIVEPLVEGMQALEQIGMPLAEEWLLANAQAALSARAADGSYGRFFDGPPPRTTTTAWQTNGGLALEIAAAAIAPGHVVRDPATWQASKRVVRDIQELPAKLTFRGSGITLLGTLGEHCCQDGHARILIDGRQTFDASGTWQNKSSSHRSIPNTILFAWRWSKPGRHTLTLVPGAVNPKEGHSFLHLAGYSVLGH